MRIYRFKRERQRDYGAVQTAPAPLIERDLLATLEWSRESFNGYDWIKACHVCGGIKPGHAHTPPAAEGHRPGCWMALALSPAPDATLAAEQAATSEGEARSAA